jgi:hypothetical protein
MGLSIDEAHKLVVELGYSYRKVKIETEVPPNEGPVDSWGNEVSPKWYWEQPLELVRAATIERPKASLGIQLYTRNVYHTSEAIRAYVLRRASDHHMMRISDGGPDDPQWVIAVCPTCHRRAHYAVDAAEYNEILKSKVKAIEKKHS